MNKLADLFLFFLWEGLQNLTGYLMSRIWKNVLQPVSDAEIRLIRRMEEFLNLKIYIVTRESHMAHRALKLVSGFSLGRYICLDDCHDLDTVRHEKGHAVWSKILGPLYLPVVGLYSMIFCNLWDRWFHLAWEAYDRWYWYYKTRWSEKSADKAGNVDRDAWFRKIAHYHNDKCKYPLPEAA